MDAEVGGKGPRGGWGRGEGDGFGGLDLVAVGAGGAVGDHGAGGAEDGLGLGDEGCFCVQEG